MRKGSSGSKDTVTRGKAGSRGNTALGTPLITSCGLFHQDRAPTREASTASSLREDDIDDGGGEHRVMLERHTSAAKDGVIEMLTAKASKLGVSLERAMVAKKEAEDRVGRLQGDIDEETERRKELEHRLHQSEADSEVSARENEHLRGDATALRASLVEAEERFKTRIQDETSKRQEVENILRQEHAAATEYLQNVYPEDRPVEEGLAVEALVRELHALGVALRERDEELRERTDRLDALAGDVSVEREMRQVGQDKLAVAQERVEGAKYKVRQLTGKLELEAEENEALRAKLRAMDEETEKRTRALDERKAKAQQRKRGDIRDSMAEKKAKDDRIKALETTLIEERERLEGELQAARSDYEESAKESRRKLARLHKRCMELEYRAASQATAAGENGGSKLSALAATTTAGMPGHGGVSRETGGVKGEGGGGGDFTHSTTPGLISVASVLPWRRGSESDAPALARRSADHLPDPSRDNDSAPAWMRSDLSVDRVQVD